MYLGQLMSLLGVRREWGLFIWLCNIYGLWFLFIDGLFQYLSAFISSILNGVQFDYVFVLHYFIILCFYSISF